MTTVQHVAITRSDGQLVVMQFVLSGPGIPDRTGTDEEIAAEIARTGITATSWRRIAPTDLPADRIDRNAWTDSGTAITVNAARKALLLDRAKDAKVDALQSDALLALATALFDVVNAVRVLKSQQPLTAAQYRAYLKSLLP